MRPSSGPQRPPSTQTWAPPLLSIARGMKHIGRSQPVGRSGATLGPPHDGITQCAEKQCVVGEYKQRFADDRTFFADHAYDGGSRHHVVHANRIASRAADRLESHDPIGVDTDIGPDFKLKQREHHVAYGIASGYSRANPADKCRKYRPSTTGKRGDALRQCAGHGRIGRRSAVAVEEYLHHRHGEH